MSETTNTFGMEAEEAIEAALVGAFSAVCSIPVRGFLSPSSEGTARATSEDTFVGVSVDLASQDGDYSHLAPVTLRASVAVRFSPADDADGSGFRDECRRVRSVLVSMTGDGCAALTVQGAFRCDALTLDSTSSAFGDGDAPVWTKTYSATVRGRMTQTTPTTTTQN